MENIISIVSRISVSRTALILFNVALALIMLRFSLRVFYDLAHIGKIDLDAFHALGEAVAVRMIAVGVLIVERADILAFASKKPRDPEQAILDRRIHPYGSFYLCFGLIMECIVGQIRTPIGFLPEEAFRHTIAGLSFAVSSVSLLVCFGLFHVFWKTRNSVQERSAKV